MGGASAGAAEVVVAERRCTVIVRCGRDGQGKPAGLLEATVGEVDVRASRSERSEWRKGPWQNAATGPRGDRHLRCGQAAGCDITAARDDTGSQWLRRCSGGCWRGVKNPSPASCVEIRRARFASRHQREGPDRSRTLRGDRQRIRQRG